jgi:O-antigen/teichoic acid export membrane protein
MKKLNSIDNKYLILADQILVSITAVLTNIFIAKFIGLKEYGQFSSVILVQLFLLGITQAFFGSTYVVLYHNNNINEKAKYTSSLLVLLFIYLLLLSIPISIYLSFTKFELSQIFFIYSSVILFFIQDFLRRVLITQQKIKATILSDAITSFLQITLLLIFFHFKILNTTTIWLIIAVTFLPSIVYAILKLKPVKNRFTKHKSNISTS